MRSVAIRILCILACSREPALAQSPEEFHHRADTALQSFLLKFWSHIDDNHSLDVTDAVALLRYIFQGASPPAAPFPECGAAPPGDLPCGEFTLCE